MMIALMKIVFILIASLIVVNFTYADPSITDTQGVWSHGDAVVIQGSDFGTKSPAAPLWWDGGEGAAINSPSIMMTGEMAWAVSGVLTGSNKHYNDVWPKGTRELRTRMQYRLAGHRDVLSPHSYSCTFLTGCHDDEGECGGGEPGQNVAINISDGQPHDVWYVSYYHRLDPRWPAYRDGHNWKEFNWEASAPYLIYSTNNYDNVNGCGGGFNDLRRSPSCGDNWVTQDTVQIFETDCGDGDGFPVITHDRGASNPARRWVHVERLLDLPLDFYQILHDNVAMLDTNLDGTCSLELHNGSAIGGATIGGFWRESFCGGLADNLNDDACRYFDDVYVDNTFARVIVGNNPSYGLCSIVEPQVPISWSSGEIRVRVNLGALSGGSAYLFVFDSNNESNATGFEIQVVETNYECPAYPENATAATTEEDGGGGG
jgi:hypothetical protein